MIQRSLTVGAAFAALLLVSNPADASRLRVLGRPAATQSVDFIVKLPLRNSAGLDQLIHLQSSTGSSVFHKFLSVRQFRAAYGPTIATIAGAEKSLRASGFTIVSTDSQLIHVRGTSSAVERAFSTRLAVTRDLAGHVATTAMRPVATPNALGALGATLVGLESTPKAKPLFRRAANFKPQPANRFAPSGGYFFDDLKEAYQYPSYAVANGRGVTIATVGQADFSSDDAATYFNYEKVGGLGSIAPGPKLEHVLLPGASPFDPNDGGASSEANLDVQQAGGSAPGATVVGVSVDGPGEPFLTAYSYLDEANYADVVSTSYGQCELDYTAAYNGGTDYTSILEAYHDLFRQGNVEGITFVFSSGDDSGIGCYPVAYFGAATGTTYHPIAGAGIWVDDPNVTSVGGTNLITTTKPGSLESRYVAENEVGDRITTAVDFDNTGNYILGAMFGSGGGVSTIFGKPSFQNLVTTGASMRAEPDVAMHMGGCPYYGPGINVECGPFDAAGNSIRDSFDYAVVGGQFTGDVGTSASAPEFAGLLAVKESVIGSRLGNENEDIYELARNNSSFSFAFFKQAIRSYNGVYSAGNGKTGYNTTTGNGTPIAKSFVLTPFAAAAGDPQTASNP